MKTRVTCIYAIIAVVLCSLPMCNGGNDALRLYGFRNFKVTIEQDGLIKQAENGEVQLYRKPFKIRVTFIDNYSIFVNASYNASAYDSASEELSLTRIPGFHDAAITEEPFNKDEILYVSTKLPNFWYYANENDHRFTSCSKTSGLFSCERLISKIKNVDTGDDPVEISKLKEDEIYVVFMQLEWSEDFSKKIEHKRDWLKLKLASADQ